MNQDPFFEAFFSIFLLIQSGNANDLKRMMTSLDFFSFLFFFFSYHLRFIDKLRWKFGENYICSPQLRLMLGSTNRHLADGQWWHCSREQIKGRTFWDYFITSASTMSNNVMKNIHVAVLTMGSDVSLVLSRSQELSHSFPWALNEMLMLRKTVLIMVINVIGAIFLNIWRVYRAVANS